MKLRVGFDQGFCLVKHEEWHLRQVSRRLAEVPAAWEDAGHGLFIAFLVCPVDGYLSNHICR